MLPSGNASLPETCPACDVEEGGVLVPTPEVGKTQAQNAIESASVPGHRLNFTCVSSCQVGLPESGALPHQVSAPQQAHTLLQYSVTSRRSTTHSGQMPPACLSSQEETTSLSHTRTVGCVGMVEVSLPSLGCLACLCRRPGPPPTPHQCPLVTPPSSFFLGVPAVLYPLPMGSQFLGHHLGLSPQAKGPNYPLRYPLHVLMLFVGIVLYCHVFYSFLSLSSDL